MLNNMTSVNDRVSTSNGAYSFNGSNSYAQVPDATDLRLTGDYTVSAWVNLTSGFTNMNLGWTIFEKYDASSDNGWYCMVLRGGPPIPSPVASYFVIGNSGTGYSYPTWSPISASTWHMITYTYDASTGNLKYYVDGSLVNFFSSVPTVSASSLDLFIGGGGPSGPWFMGAMDDLLIYNWAFSDSDVAALANEPPY